MFSKANPETACGMWSKTYIIALIIVLSLIVIGLYFSRKMSHKAVYKTIIIATVLAIMIEIGKMLFIGITYGLEEVDFLPLYFCSLFMYGGILASIKKVKVLQTMGLSFLTMGGIFGATSFFMYPSTCIPRYPIYHYMCLRTMLYHGGMIYIGLLILITKYYVPNLKDFKKYFVALIIVGILAYIINTVKGSDLMYISKPLSFIPLTVKIYKWNSKVYSLIALIVEIVAPYFLSYGIYILISKIRNKKEKNEYVYN